MSLSLATKQTYLKLTTADGSASRIENLVAPRVNIRDCSFRSSPAFVRCNLDKSLRNFVEWAVVDLNGGDVVCNKGPTESEYCSRNNESHGCSSTFSNFPTPDNNNVSAAPAPAPALRASCAWCPCRCWVHLLELRHRYESALTPENGAKRSRLSVEQEVSKYKFCTVRRGPRYRCGNVYGITFRKRPR
jgi:hypothetical protein